MRRCTAAMKCVWRCAICCDTEASNRPAVTSLHPNTSSRPAGEGTLSTINLAVDTCNVVSLHSGLPISVIDIEQAGEPFRVASRRRKANTFSTAPARSSAWTGLLCLFDADGPCGNAVKDSQRTKTGPETRRTLSLIWGSTALPNRAAETEAWYHSLLQRPVMQRRDRCGRDVFSDEGGTAMDRRCFLKAGGAAAGACLGVATSRGSPRRQKSPTIVSVTGNISPEDSLVRHYRTSTCWLISSGRTR